MRRASWETCARLLGGRLLSGGVLLVALSLACFALIEMAPGDFLTDSAMNPQWSSEAREQFRERTGLGLSFWERYGGWLGGLTRGEMGPSYGYGIDTATLLVPRLGRTAILNASAMLLALMTAAPAALFAARRPRHWGARALSHGTQSLLMIPEMVLALALVAGAVRYGIALPGLGEEAAFVGLPGRLLGSVQGMTVPCVALALGAIPVFFRHIRSAFQEALAAPFVTAARHAGLPSSMLYLRYVLPAAANPLLSLFGFTLGGMLSASLVVETITSWPGMGPLLLDAVLARDTYVVVGGVLLSAIALLAGNLAADVALLWLDPRIRR